MSLKRWLRAGRLCVPALIVLTAMPLRAQMTLRKVIDIGAGLADSSIALTTVPQVANPGRAFDGNAFTEVRAIGSSTLSLTLHFTSTPLVSKCKIFFWTAGKWILESADSESDLTSKSGSYALLRDSTACAALKWDSVDVAAHAAPFLRLSAVVAPGSEVILGEWVVEEQRTIVSYAILPYPPRVIPGLMLALEAKLRDSQDQVYPVPVTDTLEWSTVDTSIAAVGQDGHLTGVALGSTSITVTNRSHTLSGQAPVTVESDFRLQKAEPRYIKVALVIPDPIVGPGSQRLHQHYGWHDPVALANDVAFHFYEASDSLIYFEFVLTIITDSTYSRYNGTLMSVSDYMTLFDAGSLQKAPYATFDYVELVNHYGFDDLRNSGQIDEVWVFSPPWTGMYESQLMGPNAFWWNSPPITTGTHLTKLLSVMGLNYERGVDMAFHSFGHRFESAMRKAYEDVTGRDWDATSVTPSPWDLFTRYDMIVPGGAHCGNIHFPPNGLADYNYGNTDKVVSYCDNWPRYPYLLNQTRLVNVTEWYYYPGDALAEGLDHLGFLRWWYNHIPRYVGITNGVLNNWWNYFYDFEGAEALAKKTPPLSVHQGRGNLPTTYVLEQNFPNPFNPTTTIRYQLPRHDLVSLRIFDLLGRLVTTLQDSQATAPGTHDVVWYAARYASGVYFYRLTTASGITLTKKLVLLK